MEGTYRFWDRLKLPLARAPLGILRGRDGGLLALRLGNGYETINLVLAGRVALGLDGDPVRHEDAGHDRDARLGGAGACSRARCSSAPSWAESSER
jgi:hypothetical protein